MKSKIMMQLLADFELKKGEAEALIAKADTTPEELKANTEEVKAIKAKITAQESLDDGKKFDDKGEIVKPVVDTKPVNEPIYAEPADHKMPFNNFGEQLQAIANSSKQGATIDNRLLAVQNATGTSEGQPSEGGYLVQTDFATQLMEDVYANSVLASRCKKVPISAGANAITINGFDETSRVDGSRKGGVQGYWVEEAGTATASKPKFRQIELKPKKLVTLYYATDELLSDANAMESVLSEAFAGEMGFKVDDAIFRGDGSGKPLGIMNSPAVISQAKETGQAADTVIHENISAMYARLIASSRKTAVWVINQEVETFLDNMALSIGTGGQLSPFAMEYMMKGTIKGLPVIPIEQASAIGDVGDIVLADFNQYMLADKGSPKSASSIHVQFTTDEQVFRTTYRVDGQTARASAITPYKATSLRTLSSFVTLAAR